MKKKIHVQKTQQLHQQRLNMLIIVISSMRLIAQQRQDVYGLGPSVLILLAAQHLTK